MMPLSHIESERPACVHYYPMLFLTFSVLSQSSHAIAAPIAPGDLSATAQASYSIVLDWVDNSGDAVRFQIERNTEGQGFVIIGQVDADNTQFEDKPLRAGVNYAYRIQAIDDAGAASAYSNTAQTTTPRLNVLFIGVDDLRPELGAYGVDTISTPNIDELARQGTRFTRAYTQMATCSPSRTSLMTGLRPDTTEVTDLATHFRDTVPSVVTLPQYFMRNGYEAQGICKVYHGSLNDDESWSIPYVNLWGFATPKGDDGKRLAYAAVDAPDYEFTDYMCTDYAIEALNDLASEPFFLAVGLKKPHLPFVAPYRYFDMYDPDAIPEAVNSFRASGAPTFAFGNRAELSIYSSMPPRGQPLGTDLGRALKHGYYAATSFVDAQVGRLLDELARLGLADSTLVVLWSDHGWHLGEQNDWGKHTNFEVGTRVPLIFRVPGQPPDQSSNAIVELVDLYATLCELAGLPIPDAEAHGGYPLEGDSIADFIESPTLKSKRGAISQWRRGGYVGYSIRTDRYRFTEWVNETNNQTVHELYDHFTDPFETVNVADDLKYAAIIPDLIAALAAGGQQDLPPSLLPTRDEESDACGEPSIDQAEEKGLFLWRECPGNGWQVRVTAGRGPLLTYEGGITTDADLPETPVLFKLEPGDVLTSSARQMAYALTVNGLGLDGFSFKAPATGGSCFEVSSPLDVPIYLGVNKNPAGTSLDLTTLGGCGVVPGVDQLTAR